MRACRSAMRKKSRSAVRSRKNETISNESDGQLEPGLYCKSHPDCTACYRRLRSQTRPLPLAVSSYVKKYLGEDLDSIFKDQAHFLTPNTFFAKKMFRDFFQIWSYFDWSHALETFRTAFYDGSNQPRVGLRGRGDL